MPCLMKRLKNAAIGIGPAVILVVAFGSGAGADQAKENPKAAATKSRRFDFTYAATVSKVAKNTKVKLWLPIPPAKTAEQECTTDLDLGTAVNGNFGTDTVYGNRFRVVELAADDDGKAQVSMTFKVTRREVRTDERGGDKPGAKENIARFLEADKLVPVGGKALELVKGENLGQSKLEIARKLYTIVNRHMKYSKEGIGWGNGDSEWACDSKFGNCTDFHSLFISLARANKIPAKFEMGFSIPTKRGEGTIGGYHCWAWFLSDDKTWIPVDISEANRFPELRDYYFGNLSEDRVMFTTGRDINLEPRQNGPALNYFIYPYAEVNGQPIPADQIQRSFSYKDI
jgi:hypothetical protein